MLNSIFYVSDLIIKNPFLPTYHNFLRVHKPNPVSPPFSASLRLPPLHGRKSWKQVKVPKDTFNFE